MSIPATPVRTRTPRGHGGERQKRDLGAAKSKEEHGSPAHVPNPGDGDEEDDKDEDEDEEKEEAKEAGSGVRKGETA
ncbi:hypothetical protein ESCO_002793 [Escovopsis weberi]|uniref:Uncharacterized protein n=1 Tax=Escovopsis weberi TaxID=150374 RepID=A0A0M9VSI7_ESCWE|nr:hypothetical protein ESCO_002793 [Escovopsis weberi]